MKSECTDPAPTIVTGFGGQGFQVSKVAHRPGWLQMVHLECAAQVHFVDSDHNIHLYADLHDCDAREWWTERR